MTFFYFEEEKPKVTFVKFKNRYATDASTGKNQVFSDLFTKKKFKMNFLTEKEM